MIKHGPFDGLLGFSQVTYSHCLKMKFQKFNKVFENHFNLDFISSTIRRRFAGGYIVGWAAGAASQGTYV